MEFRPILSAMLRNKTGAVLVGLQIAITLAVVANALFIIVQRAEKISRPSGIDGENLFFVQSYGFDPSYDQRATVRRDLDAIRALPGVISASVINQVPMSGSRSARAVGAVPERDQATLPLTYYSVDEHGLQTLGVKLAEGRNFTEQEIDYRADPSSSEFVRAVIITKDAARELFGDEPALGKTIYDGAEGAVVIGIIENMLGPVWLEPPELTSVMLQPLISAGPTARYMVRAEPGRRDALMAEVERKLAESETTRAITWVRSLEEFKARSYRPDSRMVAFLCVLVGLMVSVTALGIVGLASFHVNVRTKQIGTRRAVGARKIDIIRYFMLENWLLTTAGVIAGTLLAFAFGQWLSSAYSLPRLEPMYVAAGVVALWVLGQLAVFVPARRAAAIPPAIATRTV